MDAVQLVLYAIYGTEKTSVKYDIVLSYLSDSYILFLYHFMLQYNIVPAYLIPKWRI